VKKGEAKRQLMKFNLLPKKQKKQFTKQKRKEVKTKDCKSFLPLHTHWKDQLIVM
jgi:hypothetical protein